MINLIKQTQRLTVATDECCRPKIALSEGGSRGNTKI